MEEAPQPASIMRQNLKQRLAFDFDQNAANLAINKGVVLQGVRHYPEHPTLPLRTALKTEYHQKDHDVRKSHLQKTYDLEVEPERVEYAALARRVSVSMSDFVFIFRILNSGLFPFRFIPIVQSKTKLPPIETGPAQRLQLTNGSLINLEIFLYTSLQALFDIR